MPPLSSHMSERGDPTSMMARHRCILRCLAVLAIVAAPEAFPDARPPELLPVVSIASVEGVITPAAILQQELHPCSRRAPPGNAVPASVTRLDLEEFERGVPAFVMHNPPSPDPRLAAPLRQYHRRYTGLLRHGHRTLYVSFIAPTLPGDPMMWRAKLWDVCDGGVALFGVEYDLHTHTFTHIAYNGTV